ncbi:SRPBCC family protein [Peterkaempfera griseoplana]|uniref:SRPBCC family protein n=1 Tax=Peterkaempfera griseoplana TaxID=66896 RepID=UPI0006E22264|nr:SRPBCC family protein [Peterkaempfera griseoplana]
MAEHSVTGTLGRVRQAAAHNPGTARLMDAAEQYLQARVKHTVSSLGRGLGEATTRLQQGDTPLQGGNPLKGGASLLGGVVKDQAKQALKNKASGAAAGLKEKLGGLLGKGGRGRGGGGSKSVTIVEDLAVGVPVRTAYDQWTQFQEFGNWSKGVRSVENADETTTHWKAKIFWSSRSWQGKVTEQIPDRRIAWTTEGAKGTTKGVVTFHPLGEELTQVLLVIEYFPKGLFEKTGNIWRAQGRRARLDLKLFRRFVTMKGEATGSWRGEIRDGEVVTSHEDGLRDDEDHGEERSGGGEPDDEYDEYDEPGEEYAEDDEPEDEFAEDQEPVDEFAEDEEPEEEYVEEPEDDPEPGYGPGDEAEDDRAYEKEPAR